MNCHPPQRSDLIVFPSAVVKMDAKSEFERVPVALLAAAVDLAAEMARVDPDGEWCRWQGAVHNLCSSGELLFGLSPLPRRRDNNITLVCQGGN